VTVHEGAYVAEIAAGLVRLEHGGQHPADLVLVATGVRPPPLFAQAGLPVGPEGGLRVDRHLRALAGGEIFGGGDCIHFEPRPLERVGVFAVRQNPVLRHNLLAALEERPLRRFDPGGAYLLIFNLGDGRGLAVRWGRSLHGRPAFGLKDWIDRRFMRRFR
jgi:NADH dehydrogenase FAD-containing subunit